MNIIRLLFFVLAFSMKASGQEIFSTDLEAGTFNEIFDGAELWGVSEFSNEQARSGSRSIKMSISNDEDGSFFKKKFPSTRSLYTRKYEYYSPSWSGNWPVGLKTGRYFTTPNLSLSGERNGAYAYMSEKLIWQGYSGNPDDTVVRGFNNAIYNKDLVEWYQPATLFGNQRPFIEAGRWYKYETWMVLNSATDVADGVLKIWIDDQIVYDNEQVVFKSSSRGIPNGEGWQSMWFGGNYSGATFGGPTETIYRYIDDLYLSTTLDREGSELMSPPKAPASFGADIIQ